jgi:threonine dehydratase
MSLFLRHINPRIKIYGVETTAMAGMAESIKAGHLVSVPKRATMADGIAIENVGALAFDIIRTQVDDIVQVDEDEMAAAVLALLEVEKTVVEASGAAALAAMQSNKFPHLAGQNVVLCLTGSNIDMTLLGRIIDKGLVKSGRLARIHVTVADIPGQLAKVLAILNDCRANVKDVEHERAFMVGNVGLTQPIITMETRDFEHVQEIVQRMKEQGFPFTRVETPTS